ncbi:MAG: hypothetical protein JKY32_15110 [Rhizobiales bacterium]|nr:hypothetical protein [Hyphomicrobiales bacterium]
MLKSDQNMPISAKKSGPFCGKIITPGDKSISHRALIFGAMARGTTSISGLLEGEDVMATGDAVAAMGAEVARDGVGKYTVRMAPVSVRPFDTNAGPFGNAETHMGKSQMT